MCLMKGERMSKSRACAEGCIDVRNVFSYRYVGAALSTHNEASRTPRAVVSRHTGFPVSLAKDTRCRHRYSVHIIVPQFTVYPETIFNTAYHFEPTYSCCGQYQWAPSTCRIYSVSGSRTTATFPWSMSKRTLFLRGPPLP